MAVCLELFNQIEKNELTWTYVLIYYRQLGCGGYTNRSFGDIEIGSNRGSSYITCTFVIGRGDIKRAVALIWIQDLYLFYYRYWVWSEIITSDYSRTSLYGHPPNTDTSLSRTVFLVRSPCIFSKFNPPNMDTPSTGTLLPPPPPPLVSILTGSDCTRHDSPRFAWLYSICLRDHRSCDIAIDLFTFSVL